MRKRAAAARPSCQSYTCIAPKVAAKGLSGNKPAWTDFLWTSITRSERERTGVCIRKDTQGPFYSELSFLSFATRCQQSDLKS